LKRAGWTTGRLPIQEAQVQSSHSLDHEPPLNTIKRYCAPRIAFCLEDRNFLVDRASLGENLVPIFWVHRETEIHLGDFFGMVGERVVGLLVLSKRNGKTVAGCVRRACLPAPLRALLTECYRPGDVRRVWLLSAIMIASRVVPTLTPAAAAITLRWSAQTPRLFSISTPPAPITAVPPTPAAQQDCRGCGDLPCPWPLPSATRRPRAAALEEPALPGAREERIGFTFRRAY
jgi:hypothetical protein